MQLFLSQGNPFAPLLWIIGGVAAVCPLTLWLYMGTGRDDE